MTRKIKAQDIFNGRTFTGPGYVLVVGENGVIEAVIPEAESGGGTETVDGIICPGFINAHCHIELSHLKNKIPQHNGLVAFVQKVMMQRGAAAAEKQEAMRLAEKELYDSGTVAVGDICNTTDSLSLKKNSDMYWQNFIEVSGFVEAGAQKRCEEALAVLDTFTAQGQLCSSLSPHAPYSVSEKLFRLINSATANNIISIHNQESPAENELYKNKSGDFLSLYKNFGIDISGFIPTGKSSFGSWLPYFDKRQKIISVHNTFTDQDDLQILSHGNDLLYFCLCPNANLYIENRLPDPELFMKNNRRIVIGTDSYASNTQLNIFEEIKTLRKYFPAIPFEEILRWATLNGSLALGIAGKYGSFEKGKQPGVVLIAADKAQRIL